MSHSKRIALIGGGPSSLYLLQHLLRRRAAVGDAIEEITVFERQSEMGVGMPYSGKFTDRFNICNISSEEIPGREPSFADWLKGLSAATRRYFGVEGPVCAKATYPRIALGAYLQAQWSDVCSKLQMAGTHVIEQRGRQIVDISDDPRAGLVWLTSQCGEQMGFDCVIVATGHRWEGSDRPRDGFYASPWPIFKLLPKEGEYFNFAVGTLGASLSAFDVATSLAHRHGRFLDNGEGLIYKPHPRRDRFKLVMHSTNGRLPHLQYDQREPFRAIYRHVSRDELYELVDSRGFLRLEVYFDSVCRPALAKAFAEDGRVDLVQRIRQESFDLKAFVDHMSSEHDCCEPFDGMRNELNRAMNPAETLRPVYWREVLDDLMYTLNFHAQLLSAEDHLRLRSVMMPFLMNVIAALPLESAKYLLALHAAGRLELIDGRVEAVAVENGETIVCLDQEGIKSSRRYRQFVDCSGQQPVGVENYFFATLVADGTVRSPRVAFADWPATIALDCVDCSRIIEDAAALYLKLDGIDVDSNYRVIGQDGNPNPRIYEIAFPHTSGLRPYSYGLQACNETASIVVDSWCYEGAVLEKRTSAISQ